MWLNFIKYITSNVLTPVSPFNKTRYPDLGCWMNMGVWNGFLCTNLSSKMEEYLHFSITVTGCYVNSDVIFTFSTPKLLEKFSITAWSGLCDRSSSFIISEQWSCKHMGMKLVCCIFWFSTEEIKWDILREFWLFLGNFANNYETHIFFLNILREEIQVNVDRCPYLTNSSKLLRDERRPFIGTSTTLTIHI